MVEFLDLGEQHSYKGIFLCGLAPMLFVFSKKGIFAHRLLVDRSVSAMTPFRNVNCPKGFILAMTTDNLKVYTLHREKLDASWPCIKVPLRCMPTKITWYLGAKVYFMLCSKPVPFRERLSEDEGGDTHASACYAVNEQSARERGVEEITR